MEISPSYLAADLTQAFHNSPHTHLKSAYLFCLNMFAPNDNNKFLAIVRLKLLANTHLSITEVNDLAFVKETYFDEGDYSTLRSLLLENNIEKVKRWSPLQLRSKEFLNVLKFRNQDNKEFIVTIYDAPSLRQDPEIIEVFPL